MTDPHLRGGGQVRYVSSLAAELTRFGHRVTIGCKPDSVLVEHAKAAGCGVDNRFTFRGGLRPLCWLADIRETRRFIQQEESGSTSQNHTSATEWLFRSNEN